MKSLLFLACLLASTLGLRAAEDYELRMVRPAKKGDRSLYTGTLKEESSTLVQINRKPADAKETKVDIQYTLEQEILAVDSRGVPNSLKAKVVKISGTFNGKPFDKFSVGDQIVAVGKKPSEEQAATVNGAPADDEQLDLIISMITLQPPDFPTDDDMFGTSKRISVGDEWKGDTRKISAYFSELVPGLKFTELSAKTKFLELVENDGKPGLRIQGEATMSGGSFPDPSVKVSTLEVKMMAKGDYPADLQDESLHNVAVGLTFDMVLESLERTPDGNQEVLVTTRNKMLQTGSSKPLPRNQ